MKGVEDDEEPVARCGVEVLLQVADDDAGRLLVFGEHAEVERIVVVEDPHLRIVGGRLAFPGLALYEVARERCDGPGGLVERPVESNRAGRTDGPELAETVRGAVTHLTALGDDGSAGGQRDGQDEH